VVVVVAAAMALIVIVRGNLPGPADLFAVAVRMCLQDFWQP
jgi:hypothetical protein